MPFLRLTRDRRGFENTYLLHADHPGARPRLLYWYRTAPGIAQGRPALDEEAIRAIEEQHPDIEFDWPAILALREVMTPEEETPEPRSQPRRERKPKQRDRATDVGPEQEESSDSIEPEAAADEREAVEVVHGRGLVDDLAGREVAQALRARYAELKAKIDRLEGDREPWLSRVQAINPDAWQTPEDVLHGVTNAGAAYEKLKKDLGL